MRRNRTNVLNVPPESKFTDQCDDTSLRRYMKDRDPLSGDRCFTDRLSGNDVTWNRDQKVHVGDSGACGC